MITPLYVIDYLNRSTYVRSLSKKARLHCQNSVDDQIYLLHMPGSSTFLLEHYELQMISVFSLDNGYQEQGAWLSEQP